MHPKIRMISVAAALILPLAAGCGLQSDAPDSFGQDVSVEENAEVETPRPAVDGERLYSIPLGEAWVSDKSWIVDSDGNEVRRDDVPEYIELTDLATGEPRYQYLRRYEDTGRRDEWGNPAVRTFCSLYDMEGNQLIDWEEKDYLSAFGEYIIRQDQRDMMMEMSELPEDYRTALFHVPTGTEQYEGVFTVVKLNEGAFLLCDGWRTPQGVVNAAGEALSGFPPPKTYYSAYAWNGYFTASLVHPYEQRKNEMEYIMDRNFREIFAAQWMSGVYGNLKGDYLAYRNGGEYGIFHPEDGILFTTDGASIEYYDGELAVVQTGSFRSENDPINASLVTVEGKEIAGGFSWLVPAQTHYDEEPAGKFLGITDGKAVMIDRAGSELASVELPGARSLNVLGEDLYTYYVEDDDRYGDGLLGPNLEVMIPAGRYTSFEIVSDYKTDYSEWGVNMENFLLQASKELGTDEPGHSIYRTDILDHAGKVIVDNITAVYDVGPGRIALRRGFDVGLMDWNGNWIVKRRIFTGFGDD